MNHNLNLVIFYDKKTKILHKRKKVHIWGPEEQVKDEALFQPQPAMAKSEPMNE